MGRFKSMMFEKSIENVKEAANWLREKNYDLWLCASREGSDPAIRPVFGVRSTGASINLVTSDGHAYMLVAAIDAQESEESGVYDKVVTYKSGTFDDAARDFLAEYGGKGPKLAAINFSAENPMADGMKLGLWNKILKLLPEGYDFRSSQELIEKLLG